MLVSVWGTVGGHVYQKKVVLKMLEIKKKKKKDCKASCSRDVIVRDVHCFFPCYLHYCSLRRILSSWT